VYGKLMEAGISEGLDTEEDIVEDLDDDKW
jgi:hypothetical protein